jgi:hypothetical protein
VPDPTSNEPIELPWLVFQALKNDTFFDLLGAWERFGPSHRQSLERQAAMDMVREILPNLQPLHCLDALEQLWYDLSGGWILEIRLSPSRYSRARWPTLISAQVILPGASMSRPTYIKDGMVYGKPYGVGGQP